MKKKTLEEQETTVSLVMDQMIRTHMTSCTVGALI